MKRILIGTAAFALVITLAGCSPSASDSGIPSRADQPALSEQGASGEEAADFADSADAAENRQIVTVGTMSITAEDPVAAAGEATRIVETAGGRIDARSETAASDDQPGGATLTLRVPSATLSDTIDDLKKLGESTNVSLQESDVTTQAQDLDARISASRASVDRITALLASATDIKVLIELEDAISERQGELESMEAQRRSLADQVSLSTIDLYLVSPEQAPAEVPETFWSGLVVGWTGFVGFVGFLLVAVGVLLPWLVMAGILGLLLLVALRQRRRRLAGRTPPDAPTPAPAAAPAPADAPPIGAGVGADDGGSGRATTDG